jgi:hypothetical protein
VQPPRDEPQRVQRELRVFLHQARHDGTGPLEDGDVRHRFR